MGYYRFSEYKKGVFRIASDEDVFMDLFVGSEGALLLDTGYGFGPLAQEIAMVTSLPLTVVNTHAHPDHVCGNFQFHGEIYIHPEEMERCRFFGDSEKRTEAIEDAKRKRSHATGETRNILPRGFDEAGYKAGGPGNLAALAEGEVFRLGGLTLEAVLLPGHTRSSMGLLWEEGKTLYTGDAINPFLWLFAPEATSRTEYLQTLHKAKKLGFEEMLCGHNPKPMPKADLDVFIEVAENADFEKGIPFEPFGAEGPKARVCPRQGFGPFDFGKPGFAAIVLGTDADKV